MLRATEQSCFVASPVVFQIAWQHALASLNWLVDSTSVEHCSPLSRPAELCPFTETSSWPMGAAPDLRLPDKMDRAELDLCLEKHSYRRDWSQLSLTDCSCFHWWTLKWTFLSALASVSIWDGYPILVFSPDTQSTRKRSLLVSLKAAFQVFRVSTIPLVSQWMLMFPVPGSFLASPVYFPPLSSPPAPPRGANDAYHATWTM